jgi:hypothetical protein
LQSYATNIHDDLAAWKRTETLLEEAKESQNAAKDKAHHGTNTSHVEQPVSSFSCLVPSDAAASINIGSPRSDGAVPKFQHVTT